MVPFKELRILKMPEGWRVLIGHEMVAADDFQGAVRRALSERESQGGGAIVFADSAAENLQELLRGKLKPDNKGR
jgi:hypothetical protein